MLHRAAFAVCFTAILQTGMAQTGAPAVLPTIAKAGDVYNPFIQKQSRLYNGVEYLGYNFKINGHACFIQNELAKGTLVYDELTFDSVPMIYDLVKDQVIIQHHNGFTKVGTISEKVKEFTLHDHHFVRLLADTASRSPIITGFYDVVHTGNTNVLVKRGKFIYEVVKDELERTFMEKDLYFIQKDGRYYPVKNYKGLLNVLPDKAKEIKQYLRKNRIKYRKTPEKAIVQAVVYYDSLNK